MLFHEGSYTDGRGRKMRSNVTFTDKNMTGIKSELCLATWKTKRALRGSVPEKHKFIALTFDKVAITSVTEDLPALTPVLLQAVQSCL